jgi:hypothetical protein
MGTKKFEQTPAGKVARFETTPADEGLAAARADNFRQGNIEERAVRNQKLDAIKYWLDTQPSEPRGRNRRALHRERLRQQRAVVSLLVEGRA